MISMSSNNSVSKGLASARQQQTPNLMSEPEVLALSEADNLLVCDKCQQPFDIEKKVPMVL